MLCTMSSIARSPLLALFALVVLVVVVSHELTASPRLVRDALDRSVPGFSCDNLRVETPSGSQDSYSHIMRAALRMPGSCIKDLAQHNRSNPQFRVDRCNVVERCWIRTMHRVTYTFIFYPTYIGFHIEER
jgi:hypothetical protein